MLIYLSLGVLSYMLLTFMQAHKKGPALKLNTRFHGYVVGLVLTILLWPLPIGMAIWMDYFGEEK
jgi:hypothetical protein